MLLSTLLLCLMLNTTVVFENSTAISGGAVNVNTNCYVDISDDETAARNLCQLLSVPIETAVLETLPTKIADKMKSSDASFNQKSTLK